MELESIRGQRSVMHDGSVGSAATHVDIAATACAELVKLLERRGHQALRVDADGNKDVAHTQRHTGGMEAVVWRLTEQLHHAKHRVEQALDAQEQLALQVLQQKQTWQQEKADMCMLFERERRQLLQKLQLAHSSHQSYNISYKEHHESLQRLREAQTSCNIPLFPTADATAASATDASQESPHKEPLQGVMQESLQGVIASHWKEHQETSQGSRDAQGSSESGPTTSPSRSPANASHESYNMFYKEHNESMQRVQCNDFPSFELGAVNQFSAARRGSSGPMCARCFERERAKSLRRSIGIQTGAPDLLCVATQTIQMQETLFAAERRVSIISGSSGDDASGALDMASIMQTPSSPSAATTRRASWSGTPRASLSFSPDAEHAVRTRALSDDLQTLGIHLSRCFGTPDAVLSDLCEAHLPDGQISAGHFEELLHSRWGAARLLTGSPQELWDKLACGAENMDVTDLFKSLQSVLSSKATEDMPNIDEEIQKMRRAASNKETQKFLARGTVSEKAAQYELEVCRRRSDIHIGRTLDRSVSATYGRERAQSTPQRRKTVQFVGPHGYGASP